jgi:hypothetical protein
MRVLPVAVLATLGLLAAACSSKSSGSAATGCTQAEAMNYTPGMAVDGSDGKLQLTLLVADPAPPSEIFGNTWEMAAYPTTGATTTALQGCTINAVASMPQMNHLTTPEPTVTASGQDYEVTPINIFMDGLWQVAFTVDCPSGNGTLEDTVNYRFCIED